MKRLLAFALLLTLAVCHAQKYEGASDYYFGWNGDPSYSTNPAYQFDSSGVPLVLENSVVINGVVTNGVFVYNPITIEQYGLHYWGWWKSSGDPKALANVLTVANWLVSDQDSAGRFVFNWSYKAGGWGTFPAPWGSAMAQGQGMSLLLRAYNATGNTAYLEAAQAALGPLTVPLEQGGMVENFMGTGLPILEEYPVKSHVLNGFMFTLIGLYDLSAYYPPAAVLFQQELATLDAALPYYDLGPTGGVSYDCSRFNLGTLNTAIGSAPYLPIVVHELQVLETVAPDKALSYYATAWAGYETAP